MAKKPTYEELEQRVKELEKQAANQKPLHGPLSVLEVNWRALVDTAPSYIAIVDHNHIIQYRT